MHHGAFYPLGKEGHHGPITNLSKPSGRKCPSGEACPAVIDFSARGQYRC